MPEEGMDTNTVVMDVDAGEQALSSPEPVKTAVPKALIGDKGQLLEGWRDKYVPEDLRSYKIFDSVQDLPSMAKMLVHQEQTLRRQGKIIPDENAPKSVWDVFYKSIGRPDNPGDYKFTKPEDISAEDLSTEGLNEAYKLFYQAGFNQKQAEMVLNLYCENLRAMDTLLEQQQQQEFEQAEQLIMQESGTAMESLQHLANKLINNNTTDWPQEKKEKFIEAVNSNNLRPYLFSFLSNVQKKFEQHRMIPESEYMTGKTPSQVNSELSELRSMPGYILRDKDGKLLKDTNIEEYNHLVAKQHQLEEELRRMMNK